MKLLRWKYVAPRLAIVLIVAAVVRFGLDPLLHWGIVASGEAAVGAKVELTAVETSLLDGELVLRGLTIADPNAPMQNLLEVPESQLIVDVNALCHGRVVVRSGEVRGLRFETDRTTSGALPDRTATPSLAVSPLDPPLDLAAELGHEWLDQVGERLSGNFVDQLESPRLAKELEQRWPHELAQLRDEVDTLRRQAKTLEQTIRELSDNPLRNVGRLQQLQTELVAAQRRFEALQAKITALPQQAEADRRSVLAARAHDEQFLRDQMELGEVDGEAITELLLGESAAGGLATAIDWIGWARRKLPTSQTVSPVERGRGTTVLFSPAAPRYVIEQLRIDGEATLGGEPIQLAGSLRAVSSEPWLVSQPTTLSLESTGGAEMTVEVVVDRRSDVAIDRLRLRCPQLVLRGQMLGNADKLAVELASGMARVDVDVKVTDEQLAGEISFQQQSVQLTPRLGAIGSPQLSTAIGKSLAHVQQFDAQVVLAGTLQKPELKIHSDLGAQVAAGLQSGARDLVASHTQAVLANAQQQVDRRLQELGQARDQAQQELLAQLGEGQQLLASLSRGAVPQLSKIPGLPMLRK